jgi:Zn-dependent M28 family amino/carboxypeptidase
MDRTRLEHHVRRLAAKPRPAGSRAHAAAARTIEEELCAAGYSVRRERFSAQRHDGVNLVAELAAAQGAPLFIVAAHYDSIPESPGADDNASGVAALLEIARTFAADPPPSGKRLRLVAFDLEELGMLGSAHMAEALLRSRAELAGMVSLEMLGYKSDQPGSQNLPPFLKGRYPDTGNFIGVVGNERSRALLSEFVAPMTRVRSLAVESLVLPGNGVLLPEARLSDHSAFWDLGYPALMVTDTSFFRNPHYHQPSDTADTLDFDFLTRVTEAVALAVRSLLG